MRPTALRFFIAVFAGAAVALFVAACSSTASEQAVAATTVAPTTSITSSTTTSTTTIATTTTTTTIPRPAGQPRPEWLGTKRLPLRTGETNAVVQDTPPELIDRRLWTLDTLPPPIDDTFAWSMASPPPADVVERSTWHDECPVPLEDLTYAQVSFFGFDGLFHTGEFILHDDFAPGVVDIFEQLHAMRFPIEQMTVTSQADLNAAPTGDSNNTATFACRQAVNSGRWSRHAHGGAIDINPFHNPYIKGDLVIPELASAYLDRNREVPGMITTDIVAMFADIGFGWGGNWKSASDWMHFSDDGT